MSDDDMPPGYMKALRLTDDIVRHFRLFRPVLPQFAFPKDMSIGAGVDQHGQYLARNDVARELLAELVSEFERRKMPGAPTVMMLWACLNSQRIPVVEVPFAELGIPGELINLTPRGRA